MISCQSWHFSSLMPVIIDNKQNWENPATTTAAAATVTGAEAIIEMTLRDR